MWILVSFITTQKVCFICIYLSIYILEPYSIDRFYWSAYYMVAAYNKTQCGRGKFDKEKANVSFFLLVKLLHMYIYHLVRPYISMSILDVLLYCSGVSPGACMLVFVQGSSSTADLFPSSHSYSSHPYTWPQNPRQFFFLPQKFCGNSAKLLRRSFVISMGVQGCLLFVFLLWY